MSSILKLWYGPPHLLLKNNATKLPIAVMEARAAEVRDPCVHSDQRIGLDGFHADKEESKIS